MSAALYFQTLFRDVLARQVEYSYGEAEDRVTTMIPLREDQLRRVNELATVIPFAGEWAWATARFAAATRPDEFLLRLDWQRGEPAAVTLYCRFPSLPAEAEFREALATASPFTWSGPGTAGVAASLGVAGPRGIAFRATSTGLRTAVYFRSEEHAGLSWNDRLVGLLAACGYPEELAPEIGRDLKELYNPGPVGVIGVDDGPGGVAGGLKFDPSNVASSVTFAFLARVGVPAARIQALERIAVGLRAEAATYVGVQYGTTGFTGFRLYFACEPGSARVPERTLIAPQRHLKAVRRLPHYY